MPYVSIEELRGLFEIFRDYGMDSVVFKVEGATLSTRKLDEGRAVLVDVDWDLEEPLGVDGFVKFYVSDVFKAIGRRVRGTVSLSVRGTDIYIDGTAVGEVVRERYVMPPEPSVDIKATMSVAGDVFRSFLRDSKRYAHSNRIFLGVREGTAYIGFLDLLYNGYVTFDGTRFAGYLYCTKAVSDTASFYSLDLVLAALPPTWFRRKGAPSVTLSMGRYNTPLCISYTYGMISLRIWIAPSIDEPEKVLKVAPKVFKGEHKSVYYISHEAVDYLYNLFDKVSMDFYFEFNWERLNVHAFSRDRIMFVTYDISESGEVSEVRNIIKGWYVVGSLDKEYKLLKYFGIDVPIRITKDDTLLVWNSDVGHTASEDQVSEIKTLVEEVERQLSEGDVTGTVVVKDLLKAIREAKKMAREVGGNGYVIITSDGSIYATVNRLGEWEEPVKVSSWTVKRGIFENAYSCVLAEYLEAGIKHPHVRSSDLLILTLQSRRPTALLISIFSYRILNVVISSVRLPEDMLAKIGIEKAPPKPEVRRVPEVREEVVNEVRRLASELLHKYSIISGEWDKLKSDAERLIKWLSEAKELTSEEEEKIDKFIESLNRLKDVANDLVREYNEYMDKYRGLNDVERKRVKDVHERVLNAKSFVEGEVLPSISRWITRIKEERERMAERKKREIIEWELYRSFDELEKLLRERGVDWVDRDYRPIKGYKLIVEIRPEEKRAILYYPEWLKDHEFHDVFLWWISKYREKYGHIREMAKELQDYWRRVVEEARKRGEVKARAPRPKPKEEDIKRFEGELREWCINYVLKTGKIVSEEVAKNFVERRLADIIRREAESVAKGEEDIEEAEKKLKKEIDESIDEYILLRTRDYDEKITKAVERALREKGYSKTVRDKVRREMVDVIRGYARNVATGKWDYERAKNTAIRDALELAEGITAEGRAERGVPWTGRWMPTRPSAIRYIEESLGYYYRRFGESPRQYVINRLRPNMSEEEVMILFTTVWPALKDRPEEVAWYYYAFCKRMGWPIPKWVKKYVGEEEK